MTAARLVARCVRGVEEVLAEEVGGLGTVRAVGHREVRFTARADPGVLGLATADDVFVVAAEADGAGLDRLRCAVAAADLDGCPAGQGALRRSARGEVGRGVGVRARPARLQPL
jgi:tRNA (guanine6-N2)-methyltransferase